MSELTEAERDAGRVRLTDAENGWITNVWNGRGGRLAEAKRDLEAILRDRLAFPREAERSYLSLEWERVAKAATKRAEAAEAEVARLRAENAAQARVLADVAALADEWAANYDRWKGVHDGPRVAIFHAHATRLRAALAPAVPATEGGESPDACTCPPQFALSGGRHHTFCPLSTAKES